MTVPKSETARMSLPQAWTIVGLVIIGGAALFYSMVVRDFLPTDLGLHGAAVGGAVLGLWFALASRRLPLPKKPSFESRPVPRAIALGLLGWLFSFYVLTNMVGDIYTRAAGAPVARTVTVSGWHHKGRNSCGGPRLAEYSWFGNLCLDSTWREQLSPGTQLHLRGTGSALGVEVESLDRNGTRLPI